ncbi:MAG: HEAT repeat domain-containing protein [Alphaproteobacteria bacterium]|nr:HEAT repeat domain-containing protein [Alphaproteobacteria bacterium]MCB9795693.1 HEAT repeat domain-containing protein [Alphaproteobacteria bacterium]
MSPILLALSLLAAPGLAFEPGELAGLSAQKPAALQDAVADTSLDAATLARMAKSADWQERQGAALVSAWREDAATAQSLVDYALVPTRARIGRVQHPAVGTALGRAVIADRLLNGDDTQLDRLGLAHALAVDVQMDPVVLAGLIDAEPDAEVRAVLVWGWRYSADDAAAQAGLVQALADAEPVVRTRAAEAAGYLPEAQLDAALVTALGDATPEVRAKAARALGWRESTTGFEALRPLLSDADAEVRLQALSAMERIQADKVADLPELVGLTDDPDPRVARLAGELR